MKGQLVRIELQCQDCGRVLQAAINRKPGDTYKVPTRVIETHVCSKAGSRKSTDGEAGSAGTPRRVIASGRLSEKSSEKPSRSPGGHRSTEDGAAATSGDVS